MRTLLLCAVAMLPAAVTAKPPLWYVTGGPMLHWSFGPDGFHASGAGLEIALWNYRQGHAEGPLISGPVPDAGRPGFGFALGLDADRKAFHAHVQPQIGWVVTGFAFGPVIEAPWSGGVPRLGLQASWWANPLFGWDMRYRYLGGEHFLCPGLYAKYPKLVAGAVPVDEEE